MIVVSLFLIILLAFAIGMVISNRDEYHHKALAQATGTGKTILKAIHERRLEMAKELVSHSETPLEAIPGMTG